MREGRALTPRETEFFKPYFTREVLAKARIVDGHVPFWLRRDMVAVVLENRIYFRKGAYQADTPEGACLLGHELTHVAQCLQGMTIWKYLWSCRRGYYQSPYEQQAYAMGRRIRCCFSE
jgi:hypothetical protein